jgi:hypothetical protein
MVQAVPDGICADPGLFRSDLSARQPTRSEEYPLVLQFTLDGRQREGSGFHLHFGDDEDLGQARSRLHREKRRP